MNVYRDTSPLLPSTGNEGMCQPNLNVLMTDCPQRPNADQAPG